MERVLIGDAVRRVIEYVVRGDFDTLKNEGMLGPSSRDEYVAALEQFLGATQKLTMPPLSAYENLHIYKTSLANKVRVDFDLWVNGELSDLTAQIYVAADSEPYSATLYDLRLL